jgi:hypothetical protein
MIAYLLLKLVNNSLSTFQVSLQQLTRLISANLFQRKSVLELIASSQNKRIPLKPTQSIVYGVFRGTEETLDFQVLFNPFEKQFNLLALLVQSHDFFSRVIQVIGNQRNFLFIFLTNKPNTT